jgi:hypothetical protein
MKVAFDYDNTLSNPHVQKYAKKLMDKGIDVWVCTSRYDEDNKHKYPLNPSNDDLYMVTDVLEIPREKIIFTNRCMKVNHLDGFLWHLDDLSIEVDNINVSASISCVGINSTKPFRHLCDKLILNENVGTAINMTLVDVPKYLTPTYGVIVDNGKAALKYTRQHLDMLADCNLSDWLTTQTKAVEANKLEDIIEDLKNKVKEITAQISSKTPFSAETLLLEGEQGIYKTLIAKLKNI